MEPPPLHSLASYLTDAPPLPARDSNVSSKARHSSQNVKILSAQLRALERTPKRTQLRIANPRLTENSGLTPGMVNQLKLSAESDLPPPAPITRPPLQVSSMTSSMKLKKMMKTRPPAAAPAAVDKPPRPSDVGKDRSSSITWKKPSRGPAISQTLQSVREENQPIQGITQKLKTRASAAAAVTNWHDGVGDAPENFAKSAPVRPAKSAPVNISNLKEYAGESRSGDAVNRIIGKKAPSTQKYNIFSFFRRKKTPRDDGGSPKMPKMESILDCDLGSVKANSESSKVLDYTIKTLRYKLVNADQERAAAVEEVRVLQAALEASDAMCHMLSQQCQELELKVSARSSLALPDSDQYFSSQEQFRTVFEDATSSLRKLAAAICYQIRGMGESATQVITALLEQQNLVRTRMPRNVIIIYFEAFLNQVMFESFENVSFEPNGASPVIDTATLKQTCYESYQELTNQNWPTIEKSLRKPGALVVNANFHRFFVVRMELLFSQLGKLGESEIPLSLMAAFFNSVKAVWLVHHMALAFDHPVSIFRVSPAADFDPRFMEHVAASHQSDPDAKVSIMLNPGFSVNHQIIKCQVYCS